METGVGHRSCAQSVPRGGWACRGCILRILESFEWNWQFAVLIIERKEGKPCGGSGAQEDAPRCCHARIDCNTEKTRRGGAMSVCMEVAVIGSHLGASFLQSSHS